MQVEFTKKKLYFESLFLLYSFGHKSEMESLLGLDSSGLLYVGSSI